MTGAIIDGAFSKDVTIGGTVNNNRHAKGLLDDLSIFNVALAKNDIKTLMVKGLGKALGLLPVSPFKELTLIWAKVKARQ